MSDRVDQRSPRDGDGVGEVADALRGLWASLVRRRREFFAAFLTVALVVQLVSFLWPATYVARATVLIQNNRTGSSFGTDAERQPTVVSSAVSEEEVRSEIAVLTSREVLEKTLTSTGLDTAKPSLFIRLLFGPAWLYDSLHAWWHEVPAPTQADRALRGLESGISVEPLKDSNVLVVSFESDDPRLAEIVLGQLLEHYRARHLEMHRQGDVETFFETQAGSLQEELKGHEETLQSLKRAAGVSDLDAERAAQSRLDAALREESWALQRTIAELDRRIADYELTLRGGGRRLEGQRLAGNDFVMQDVKQEALQLELERVRLLERYRPDSPLLVENQKKLDAARAAIRSEGEGSGRGGTGGSAALIAVQQDLARDRAERAGTGERLAKLETQLASSSERMRALDESMLEAKRIERLIQTTETKYLQFLRRGVEARIDVALDQGRFTNASIVQAAAAESKPIRPKKLLSLAIALGGGLLAGLGTVVFLELREAGLERTLGSVAPRAPEAS